MASWEAAAACEALAKSVQPKDGSRLAPSEKAALLAALSSLSSPCAVGAEAEAVPTYLPTHLPT